MGTTYTVGAKLIINYDQSEIKTTIERLNNFVKANPLTISNIKVDATQLDKIRTDVAKLKITFDNVSIGKVILSPASITSLEEKLSKIPLKIGSVSLDTSKINGTKVDVKLEVPQAQLTKLKEIIEGVHPVIKVQIQQQTQTPLPSTGGSSAHGESSGFTDDLSTAFSKFPIWIIASTVVMESLHKIQEAFSFVNDTNRQLTTLQMEMTNTSLNFDAITKQANGFAIAMGSSTEKVIEAISIFGNYNATMEDTILRSKSAVLLSNLTGQAIGESSNQILAMQQQFGYSATQSEHLVDVLAGTARQLQIDYPEAIKEVASGIAVVGSVANQSGVSLEKLSGMIGTVADATRQSGSTIGWKFMDVA